MTRRTSILLLMSLLSIAAVVSPPAAWAKEEYARKTGQGCIFCHQESTGGPLKTVGFAYIRNGYRYPISSEVLEKAERLQRPWHKALRFIVGYLHLLAAVIFFGAIFYIHIFVRPMRLSGGIPKPERLLGVSCMILLTTTGIYLTWARMDRWEQFWDNTFGLMLSIKIGLFGLMIAIAMVAITIVHRKMKAEVPPSGGPETVTRANLPQFDGTDGRPAYFVHAEQVYDASQSPKWKGGRHFGKHTAGTDLTEALKGAPHGPEVLARLRHLGPLAVADAGAPKLAPARRAFVIMAYTNLVLIFLILACIGVWRWDFPIRLLPERSEAAIVGQTCIECHRVKTPGVVHDWESGMHAQVDVHCDKCHHAVDEASVLRSHLEFSPNPVAVVVSPKNCQGCHPQEAEQYSRSKHANTWEIMWKVDVWLNQGANNAIEKTSGCYACHGTTVVVENGKPLAGTWPNVGVGRVNPDGSKGSCTSCHTRHRFSIAEARKPEACDQCHLGPDHPQIEIYTESKHGTLYHAEGHEWQWDPRDRQWRAAIDYRAPTCATCHMSAVSGKFPASHDVTERLSWETQTPRTVRPQNFEAFPAATDWQAERRKMEAVCLQCHASAWTQDHFSNLDQVIQNYDEQYYDPIKALMDQLYADGLISREKYFDEEIEWHFYEFWHHEGRRARMGTAMMAPDYAWWHGFYELKHRFVDLHAMADDMKNDKGARRHVPLPGRSQ
ncbi:MAG: CopD family protein [Desulfobacterales bacterium]|nr:CopD family protein [Desulfobacterales bacterium]